MYDVFAETAVEGTYDVTDKKKQTPKQYQQQQRTRNMFDLKQNVVWKQHYLIKKGMTQLENLIHGYKMMNIRK